MRGISARAKALHREKPVTRPTNESEVFFVRLASHREGKDVIDFEGVPRSTARALPFVTSPDRSAKRGGDGTGICFREVGIADASRPGR